MCDELGRCEARIVDSHATQPSLNDHLQQLRLAPVRVRGNRPRQRSFAALSGGKSWEVLMLMYTRRIPQDLPRRWSHRSGTKTRAPSRPAGPVLPASYSGSQKYVRTLQAMSAIPSLLQSG